MSNRNSSTGSQLTSAIGISNRNINRSSKLENRRNRNRSMKTCNLSWNIDSLTASRFTRTSSPVFSSVDDDLKWHLEFLDCLGSSQSISIILIFNHEKGFFKKYNSISGDAELSFMRSDGSGNVQKKKKNFEIHNTGDDTQVLPSIRFSGFVDTNTRVRQGNQLKIVCKVTYTTTEKKIRKNPFHGLSDDLEYLLFNKQFSDAIVKVKGKEYPVFKGILAARSPVFERMFREDNGMLLENTTNIVEISDFSPEVIEEMLRFIYTGKVEKLEKLVNQLLHATDKYQLEGLMEICEDMLSKQLSKDNVINTLILAYNHNADWLKMEALQFIKLNLHPADLNRDSEIWEVLTSNRDLMKDLIDVLLTNKDLKQRNIFSDLFL
ncbi:speckle-type POZ protein-like [Planococcus citri]|uniref:speckle-type POZ protein-like n=1 Tax=Planococcus citri TaxID=170843 RepID=UPI0031F74F55